MRDLVYFISLFVDNIVLWMIDIFYYLSSNKANDLVIGAYFLNFAY